MNEITMLGIDLAKNVFQLHGVDGGGQVLVRRQVRRQQLMKAIAQLAPTTVAMEACAGAHEWGRRIARLGHRVLVKSHKTDRNDAEAICEAALRPTMRFVALKSVEQQQMLALHRLRAGAVKIRTATANRLRGILLEFGVVIPQGIARLRSELSSVLEDAENSLPPLLRAELAAQMQRLRDFDAEVAGITSQIEQLAAAHEPCRRLMQRRGIGALTASAFVAELGDHRAFRNGRQVGAWLGLVPRQQSSGGRAALAQYGLVPRVIR